MTPPSRDRDRIRNSNPGGLVPSSLSLCLAPHNIDYSRVSRGETFCFFETLMPESGLKPRSPTFQAGRQPLCIPDRERSMNTINGHEALKQCWYDVEPALQTVE